MSKSDAALLAEYKEHALNASFHYADDSAKEWGMGDKAKAKAMAVYDENPHLQQQIREQAGRNQLWSLSLELEGRKRRGA